MDDPLQSKHYDKLCLRLVSTFLHGQLHIAMDRVENPKRLQIKSAKLDTFLKEEFIEMTFSLEAKAMYTFKGIGYFWMNKKKIRFVQLLGPFY